jgi:type I restriction enzyme S subunit
MSTDKLPDGWTCVKFGDVVRNVNENSRDLASDGLDRVVGLDHLDPGSLRLTRWDYLADLPDGTTFTRKFKPGQVLFGKRRAYQRKVAVPDFAGVCSGDILVFEPADKRMLAEFLPYLVQSDGFFDHALGTSAGSLSPRTKWAELAKYEFALPSIDDQAAIGGLIHACDQMLEAARTARRRSVSLRSSLMLAELRACPDVLLGDVITSIDAGKSPPSLDRIPTQGERAVLKVSAVRNGWFDAAEMKALPPHVELPPETLLRDGDVLVSRANTSDRVGWACRVRKAPAGVFICDKTLRLSPRSELIHADYLVWALGLPSARVQIESLATGSSASMKNISQAKLRSVTIPLPNIEQQAALMGRIAQVGAYEEQLDLLANSRLKDLRSSILQRELSRVSEVSDVQ